MDAEMTGGCPSGRHVGIVRLVVTRRTGICRGPPFYGNSLEVSASLLRLGKGYVCRGLGTTVRRPSSGAEGRKLEAVSMRCDWERRNWAFGVGARGENRCAGKGAGQLGRRWEGVPKEAAVPPEMPMVCFVK